MNEWTQCTGSNDNRFNSISITLKSDEKYQQSHQLFKPA